MFPVAALSLVGCPSECVDGEERCADEMVQHCHDGMWEEAEDCETDMTCQVMGDGTEHCMAAM